MDVSALSNETLLPSPLQSETVSNSPVFPLVEPYSGRSARQQAIETITDFGTPELMYLGVNKDTIGRVSVRKEAHWQCGHQKYMSLNVDFSTRRKRRVVVIDIDDRWEDDTWKKLIDLILDGEIPTPAFACTRMVSKSGERRRTRAHLIYLLQFPFNEGDSKQKFYMDVVLEQFYDVLESHGIAVDRRQGVTFKNPAANAWDVHFFGNHRHSLRDWAEMFSISDLEQEEKKAINRARYKKKMARRAGRATGITGDRNLDVFEQARHKCYAAKARCVSYEQFHIVVADVVQETHDALNFPKELSSKELSQITKSIAEWTWYKYPGSDYCDRNRGACSDLLEYGMDRQDRQRIGAGYTHDRRVQKAIEKIKKAYHQLLAAGERITVRSLAAAAGVSATTVQKYRKRVEDGSELASKATAYAHEARKRLSQTSQIEQMETENAPCGDLYRDGASEYPLGEYLNGHTKHQSNRTLIEDVPDTRNDTRSKRARVRTRPGRPRARPRKRSRKPGVLQSNSVHSSNPGTVTKSHQLITVLTNPDSKSPIQISKLTNGCPSKGSSNGPSRGRSPPLAANA